MNKKTVIVIGGAIVLVAVVLSIGLLPLKKQDQAIGKAANLFINYTSGVIGPKTATTTVGVSH